MSYPPGPPGPYNPPGFYPPVPPHKSRNGLWIGLAVGALVLLLLCCLFGYFVVRSAPDPDPSPTVSAQPTLSEARRQVFSYAIDTLTNYHTSAQAAGFPSFDLRYSYLLDKAGSVVKCSDSGVEVSGTSDKVVTYWCPGDQKYYISEVGFTKALADSSDTANRHLLNSYAFAVASNSGSEKIPSAARKYCTAGAIMKQEVVADRANDEQVDTMRSGLTTNAKDRGAYDDGFESGKASTCEDL